MRVQAIRSLSSAASTGSISSALLTLAKSPYESESIRAASMKSLYGSQDEEIFMEMANIMESPYYPVNVRSAAAWGLFAASYPKVRFRLALAALNKDYPVKVRAEALKSLFNSMANPDMQNAAAALAKSPKEPAEIKTIAERLLKDKAGTPSLETVRFFHLNRYKGAFIDPLELE